MDVDQEVPHHLAYRFDDDEQRLDDHDVVAVEMKPLRGARVRALRHEADGSSSSMSGDHDEDDESGTADGRRRRKNDSSGCAELAGSLGDTVEMDRDEYFGGRGLDGHDGLGANAELIVDVDNVHKTYLLGVEGVPALRGVSLGVRRGEFVCVFGTSGGGKSSLLNIIGTIDQPTKGSLYLCGKRVSHHTADAQTASLRLRRIGFVFQTFNLVSSLTAVENVELPMLLEGSRSRAERRERAQELLTLVGMGDRLDHLPSQLSGGEQQRVTIARSIANDPDLLLLDEPCGDLDTVNTAIVMNLLLTLHHQGMTLIMVTHDMNMKFFSDRVIWLRDGKIMRIETVSSRHRIEAERNLLQSLKDLGIEVSKDSRLAAHFDDDAQTEQEEKQQSVSDTAPKDQDREALGSASGAFRVTQLRRPADYPTHPAHNPLTAKHLSN
eukprot:CAMPEP_0177646732 /NCGR_PEP_ID=MMETSP0447-20121125/9925_1 /TAXON_ID=0 /ORGANISM="Stygamoeba regulata, Strain BSH-02190019" /LENGTH=437 /DNA_ID=CAMNT_0019149273 /DNA_START=157 /DNA_END=1467 /DNA_ORIENTATION=-